MAKSKTPKQRRGLQKPAPPETSQTIQRIYVAYPESFMVPVDDIQNLPNTYMAATDQKCLWVDHYARKFEETKDPFTALRALTAAHRMGVYPPIDVLEFLIGNIDLYLKCGGKKKLDLCLGLIGKRGKPNFFEEQNRSNKIFELCFDVLVWKRVFGKTQDTAFLLVSRLYPYTWETLKRNYSGGRWKIYKDEAARVVKGIKVNEIHEQYKKEFISKYPYFILEEEELKNKIDTSIRALHKDYRP